MALARALKLSLHFSLEFNNYLTLHQTTDRDTPEMYGDCKLSLLMFKIYNNPPR
jgi:hypothetical protein